MVMSLSFFFSIFLKCLISGVVSGVKGQKMDQNDKKNLSVSLRISGTVHQMIVIFGTYV